VDVLTTLDELAALVNGHPDVCVRYSKGPDADAARSSVDYESGLELPGLSAIPLRPERWWTRDPLDWYARQLNHYVHLKDRDDRRCWLLVGTRVGDGPDREPLLEPWTGVAWLDDELIAEARRRYEANFDAGRDSAA
jgi:hypothetical protein